jgi:aminoglycoside 6-adenylyltransferase
MRSEQTILDLILETARQDDRIRAVVMNGSRANPNAPRDIFQDFDVVYYVTDIEPFRNNLNWIDRFGERMMLQMPEAMQDPPPLNDGSFNYLMQFMDGNRIDLTLLPLAMFEEIPDDSLSIMLLDKDGRFQPFDPPSDSDYLPKPPTAQQFSDCCNEFWWVSLNVAKGWWREEIPYAKHMLDVYMRDQLMKMLTWYVGVKTQFSANPGKFGKYLKRYLEPELWAMLEKTYSDASYEHTWDALFSAGDLFRTTAIQVAEHGGFDYPYHDDERVSAHLRHVRTLPRQATDMY